MSTFVMTEHQKTIIKVDLTHSILSMRIPEVRLSRNDPVIDVKMHLEKRFGTGAGSMKLVLKNPNGENIVVMSEDYQTIGNYGADNEFIIHCIDENPNSILKELEDLSQIEKYVMSDEDYDKLSVNVRKFKKQLKKNNPELFLKKEIKNLLVIDPDHQKDLAENIKKEMRCELQLEKHRGEVKYVGKVPDLGDGYFVGIALDEPFGNTDGQINGVQFFECLPKYGVFRRPSEINVGDFPEEDIDEI